MVANITCTSGTTCISAVGDMITDFNLFGLGPEPIAIMAVIIFTAAVATTKEDWAGAMIFGYLIMFVIGLATQMWIFIMVVVLCMLYLLDTVTSKD